MDWDDFSVWLKVAAFKRFPASLGAFEFSVTSRRADLRCFGESHPHGPFGSSLGHVRASDRLGSSNRCGCTVDAPRSRCRRIPYRRPPWILGGAREWASNRCRHSCSSRCSSWKKAPARSNECSCQPQRRREVITWPKGPRRASTARRRLAATYLRRTASVVRVPRA